MVGGGQDRNEKSPGADRGSSCCHLDLGQVVACAPQGRGAPTRAQGAFTISYCSVGAAWAAGGEALGCPTPFFPGMRKGPSRLMVRGCGGAADVPSAQE